MMKLLITAKMRTLIAMRKFADDLLEERGDTNFVAIIVIIVIIVGIAGLFKTSLETAVGEVFDKLMGFIRQ